MKRNPDLKAFAIMRAREKLLQELNYLYDTGRLSPQCKQLVRKHKDQEDTDNGKEKTE